VRRTGAGPATSTAELSGPLPTFLLVGAQKSATTSVIHYLGGHPDVFALQDEVHFFDRHHDLGLDWYRSRFARVTTERAVGESTPEYMYLPEVLPRVAGALPDARLITVLRDPVDRAYSHFWHNRTRGLEDLSFEDALEAEAGRLASGDPTARARYSYLDRGRYLAQIQRILAHYPAGRLRVILFDDLRHDRVAVVRSLYRFLDVDDSVVPPTISRERNRFVTFRSQRLRKPIRRLPRPLRRVAARFNIRYTSYPRLAPEVRRRVAARLRDENRALAAWLGRDLAAWDG
jgi:Sulfotransferase domain